MSTLRTLDNFDVNGKKILVRIDLNVPLQDGTVSDTSRIESVVPTLEELSRKGARVIALSHFGRPKGRVLKAMSLAPIVPHLSAAMNGRKIVFSADCIGEKAHHVVNNLRNGDIALLENTRFHAGEEANSNEFILALASLADFYVNDAFSAAHRAHASTTGVAALLPSAAGRLMARELSALENVLTKPERPLMAVVGGAKVSTKIDLLTNLVQYVDLLAIGGAMANTFLDSVGVAVGTSLTETGHLGTARRICHKAEECGCHLILPIDGVVAREFVSGARNEVCTTDSIPADGMILDLGPNSVAAIEGAIQEARTLVWNGPLGAFEIPPFDSATTAAAAVAAECSRAGTLLSVAGGGDTVAALQNAGVMADFSYVSMAGGAFLEWLEGKALPGVEALRN